MTYTNQPEFRLTIRNYRGFSDENPLHIEFKSGFVALVGPNNSGKSSLLRLFHELRAVFSSCVYPPYLPELFRADGRKIEYNGVEDPLELFNEQNERDLQIEMVLPDAADDEISRVELHATREYPDMWHAVLCAGPQYTRVEPVAPPARPGLGYTPFPGINLDPFYRAMGVLHSSLYVGPFRHLLTGSSGSHYDLVIGGGFVQQWHDWKTGPNRRWNRAVQRVTEDIRKLFGFHSFEVNAAANQSTLQIIVDGKPYRLREWGAGLAQFIFVLGSVTFRNPTLLLVDEPESNLHPSLQSDFLTSLASYASYGVMYATHSLGLARSVSDRIYSFRRTERGIQARIFEQTPNYIEFLGEMSYSAFKELGHDLVLLVEGVTDVRTVQQFLRVLRLDHRIVVLPLGGSQLIKAGVELELAELKRLAHDVAVLIDSERTHADSPLDTGRQAFVADCSKLGFRVHVTERRAFENYMSDEAVKCVKGVKYSALHPYETLRDRDPCWAKAENWRIAREMNREDLLATDVGKFLTDLFDGSVARSR
jgi:energy-coupling factor transporter ATP-binding protein EcfA2